MSQEFELRIAAPRWGTRHTKCGHNKPERAVKANDSKKKKPATQGKNGWRLRDGRIGAARW
jgi:hypothetical protein